MAEKRKELSTDVKNMIVLLSKPTPKTTDISGMTSCLPVTYGTRL